MNAVAAREKTDAAKAEPKDCQAESCDSAEVTKRREAAKFLEDQKVGLGPSFLVQNPYHTQII